MSFSEATPFLCREHGMLWVPRPGHYPCPEGTPSDGAADNGSTMCYCSVTVLTEEQQQPTSSPSDSQVAYFDARSTVDEHFAVDEPTFASGEEASRDGPTSSRNEASREGPTSSGDEASGDVRTPPWDDARYDGASEAPFSPPTATGGHNHAADDALSPPWAPLRQTSAGSSGPVFPWDCGSPIRRRLWASRSRASFGAEEQNGEVRFPSPPSFTRPRYNGSGWRPIREWDRNGAAMAAWASQQHQSLPRFSPPPPPYSSSGEGPSGLGGRYTAARRRGEASHGPAYPEHAPFMGSAGAQDNGPYPAPPPRPQQAPPLPRYHHQQRPHRQSRFVRPHMTRWPTPLPPCRPRRLDLEITYCPAQHAPGAVASTRTYFPEHAEPATFYSSSTNSYHRRTGRPADGFGVNNGSRNGVGANRHLHASSASPTPSPPRDKASQSPGSSPPRHVFQAELDFVQPNEGTFSMAAATHPVPRASSSPRRPTLWQRMRNVVLDSWRRRRSRYSEEARGEHAQAVKKEAGGYKALDDEDGDEDGDSEAWSEIGQPADSDSGEMVDCGDGEGGPSVREAVRSKERFSMD